MSFAASLRSSVRPVFSARSLVASSSTRTFARSLVAPTAAAPKIDAIVDSISTLTLLEAADLVSALKEKLNITEIAMPAGGAAPAAAAAPAAEAEPEEKPAEKTLFAVKLESFDASAKAKVIREVKAVMPNMNLVEAKKFVESAPQILKENMSKEDAEALKKKLMDLGCVASLD